jgi:ABC-type multidrug transport system permease subunit
MRYFSLLRDSIKESLDRKSFIITLVVCLLLILVCASIGFETYPAEKAVQRQLDNWFKFHNQKSDTAPRGVLARGFPVSYRVTEVREAGIDWSARMEVTPVLEFHKLVRFYLAAKSGEIKQPLDPIPGVSPDGKSVLDPPSRESMAEFIESRMTAIRFVSKATIESVSDQQAVFRLDFKADRPEFFVRGHRVNVFFGGWTIDREYAEARESVYFIQKMLAGVIVGWAGVFMGIIITAGFIPNMLQKGMVDLILARPVHRWKVFLLKYVGGLTYVFAAAVFLIAGCWLVFGLRSGSWSPGFLMCIPLLMFFFAAVYAVSAFIGLHKRNVTEAIMVAITAWLGSTSLGFIHEEMNRPGTGLDMGSAVRSAVNAAHAVTPPLGEVGTAVSWFLMKGNGITPEKFNMSVARGPRDEYPNVRWARLFGVTGAWMALLLGLSCWTFSRRDY